MQAERASKMIPKLPPRPSRRLRGYTMSVRFADRGRMKEATEWLHAINGDVATGKDKALARRELGYGSEGGASAEIEAIDPAEMGARAARFIGREHLEVIVEFDDIEHRGMPLAYLEGLSEVQLTITAQVSKDKMVASRWEVNGNHTGTLLRTPATKRNVTIAGMTLIKFDEQRDPNGKGRLSRALEEWTYWDLPSLAAQIGAEP